MDQNWIRSDNACASFGNKFSLNYKECKVEESYHIQSSKVHIHGPTICHCIICIHRLGIWTQTYMGRLLLETYKTVVVMFTAWSRCKFSCDKLLPAFIVCFSCVTGFSFMLVPEDLNVFDSNIFQQANKFQYSRNFHGKRKLGGAKKLPGILLVNYQMN